MARHIFRKLHATLMTPLLLAMLLALACSAAATATPAPTATRAPAAAAPQPTPTPVVVAATPTPVPTATPAPAKAEPAWVKQGKHYRGVIPFVWRFDPGFWDVHYGGSLHTTLTPSGPRYNQLLEYNPVKTDEIIGDLAKSWELSKDGTVYTFRLHDAKWTDGKPVTAEDVVFTLDRIVEPGALRARTGHLSQFYERGTAQVIDEKTVKVPIKFPTPTFLLNIATDYFKIYPKHVAGKLTQDELNCCPEKMIGSGPWMFKGWKRGDSYEYERNPNYFKEGRPFFDGFKVFLIDDNARVLSALKIDQVKGTYGPVTGLYKIPDLEKLEEETGGKKKAIIMQNEGALAWFIKWTEPPFNSPKVRRALYLAIDRQEVIDAVWQGKYASLGTFFQPGRAEGLAELARVPGFRQPKDQDIAEAKRLLAEAGYGNGFKATINTNNDPFTVDAASVIAEQLRKHFNIDITLDVKPLADMYVRMRDGVHPLTTVGTGPVIPDPSDILNQMYELKVLRNPHNWSDPKFTELMGLQLKELDPLKRQAIFKDMVEILRRGESHWLPIAWWHLGGVLDYRFQNYHVPTSVQLIHKWEHVWFDPDAPLPRR